MIDNCHVQSGTISSTGNDSIKDVNIDEARNGGSRVGGICGQNNDGGTIQNCTNEAEITAGYRLVGGICGYSLGGNISNCENRGEVHGSLQIGGIVGDSEGLDANNISYIKDCKNYEDITQTVGEEEPSSARVGGITGTNYKYSIIEIVIMKELLPE